MRIKQSIAFVILATTTHLCFGQGDNARNTTETPGIKSAPMYTALYILRSDLRTVELDPKKNELFDVKSIDQKFVKFVTVLGKAEGKKMYGDKGANGVVIVQLADHYALSKESLISFRGK